MISQYFIGSVAVDCSQLFAVRLCSLQAVRSPSRQTPQYRFANTGDVGIVRVAFCLALAITGRIHFLIMETNASERGRGIVLKIPPREKITLSRAERDAAGGDIVRKTFPDSVGLTTSDNGGPKIVSDVYISIIFWGKEWVRVTPPPPVSVNDVSNAIAKIIFGPYMSGLSQYGVNPIIQSLWFHVEGTSDPPLSPNTFADSNVDTFLQGLADGGVLVDIEERGGPAVPWGNPISFVCVIMPTNANFTNASLNGQHSSYSWTHARDSHGYNESKIELAWVLNNGTLDSITTIFSHELVEAFTDPEGNAVQVNPRNATNWNEIGDVCSSTLAVDGVTVQSYWSTADNACIVPYNQATSYRVTCITKIQPVTDPYRAITRLGGVKDSDGSAWQLAVGDVIKLLDAGDRFYVHGADGSQSDLEAYLYFPSPSSRGNRHVRTKRDWSIKDNLLSLPQCP
jgi:hypothetical protein